MLQATAWVIGSGVVVVVGTVGLQEYADGRYAARAQMEVAAATSDFLADEQQRALLRDIAYLEQKKDKTPEEINTLNYLRERLEALRRVQKGKK